MEFTPSDEVALRKATQHNQTNKTRDPQSLEANRKAIRRKPPEAQSFASSKMDGAKATDIKAQRSWTRWLRSC
jgi:hypothetical protein